MDAPDPRPDQVLIKVKAAGICGSDVECFEGISSEGRYEIAPYTPGHEWAGQVVAVGSQVAGFRAGDKVTGDGLGDLRIRVAAAVKDLNEVKGAHIALVLMNVDSFSAKPLHRSWLDYQLQMEGYWNDPAVQALLGSDGLSAVGAGV